MTDELVSQTTATANLVGTTTEGGSQFAWLFYVFLALWSLFMALFCWMAVKRGATKNLGGKAEPNGMHKMWMYKQRPYTRVALLVGLALASFAIALLLIMAFGNLSAYLATGFKYVVFVVLLISPIALLGGIGCFFKKRPVLGGVLAVLSAISFYKEDAINAWAETVEKAGAELGDKLDIASWTTTMLAQNSSNLVKVIAYPLGAFLAVALLLMLASLVLKQVDDMRMRKYNVDHACPNCGNKEGFDYLIARKKRDNGWFLTVDERMHPVELRPGIYGLLHHTHPQGDKVPTLLSNGKGNLARFCPVCRRVINKDNEEITGTSVHIGLAGVRSSGKSYMLFSALKGMKNKYKHRLQQIDVDNNEIDAMYARIEENDGIQTADRSLYKAVQVMLTPQKEREFPYHLYFYDVAGEKFNSGSTSSNTGLDTYKNVKTILFLIDPTTIDTSSTNASAEFEKWQNDYDKHHEENDIESTFMMLNDILEKNGRNKKDINIMFVCTKADIGYLSLAGIENKNNNEQMKDFVENHLGLNNMVSQAKALFGNVSYRAVSITDGDSLQKTFADALISAGVSKSDL